MAARNRSRLRATKNVIVASRQLLRGGSANSLLAADKLGDMGQWVACSARCVPGPEADTCHRQVDGSIYNIENRVPAHDWANRDNSSKRRKRNLKRKDSIAEIYGDDADRDQEGKWADIGGQPFSKASVVRLGTYRPFCLAFGKLTERAETQAIDSYLEQNRPQYARTMQEISVRSLELARATSRYFLISSFV